MLHPFPHFFPSCLPPAHVDVSRFIQAYNYSVTCQIVKLTNTERIVQSYLSEACHLLPLPASFSQGVDGHVAGCLGSLDGTDKVQTPKWCRERAAESAPAPRLRCRAGTPLCRLGGITDSVPE